VLVPSSEAAADSNRVGHAPDGGKSPLRDGVDRGMKRVQKEQTREIPAAAWCPRGTARSRSPVLEKKLTSAGIKRRIAMSPSPSRQHTPPQQPVPIDPPKSLRQTCVWATGYALMAITFLASCTTDRAKNFTFDRREVSDASSRGSLSSPLDTACQSSVRTIADHSLDDFLTSLPPRVSSPKVCGRDR
jgi:hypothetical protein